MSNTTRTTLYNRLIRSRKYLKNRQYYYLLWNDVMNRQDKPNTIPAQQYKATLHTEEVSVPITEPIYTRLSCPSPKPRPKQEEYLSTRPLNMDGTGTGIGVLLDHNGEPIPEPKHTLPIPYRTLTARLNASPVYTEQLFSMGGKGTPPIVDRFRSVMDKRQRDRFDGAYAATYARKMLTGRGKGRGKSNEQRERERASKIATDATAIDTGKEGREGTTRKGGSSGQHEQSKAKGQVTSGVDENNVDDVVSIARCKYYASRQHKRTPLDTRGSVRFAVKDYWRMLKYDSQPIDALEGIATEATDPVGYLILTDTDDRFTNEQLNKAVHMLMNGATKRQVADGIGITPIQVSEQLIPRLRAIYA